MDTFDHDIFFIVGYLTSRRNFRDGVITSENIYFLFVIVVKTLTMNYFELLQFSWWWLVHKVNEQGVAGLGPSDNKEIWRTVSHVLCLFISWLLFNHLPIKCLPPPTSVILLLAGFGLPLLFPSFLPHNYNWPEEGSQPEISLIHVLQRCYVTCKVTPVIFSFLTNFHHLKCSDLFLFIF